MQNFKELLNVKSQKFDLKTIECNIELKQMTISQHKEYVELVKNKEENEYIYFALNTCMVNPTMITKEEYIKKDDLSIDAKNVFDEIFNLIPLIGKTEKQIEDYKKMILDLAIKNAEKSTDEKEEEVEKK